MSAQYVEEWKLAQKVGRNSDKPTVPAQYGNRFNHCGSNTDQLGLGVA